MSKKRLVWFLIAALFIAASLSIVEAVGLMMNIDDGFVGSDGCVSVIDGSNLCEKLLSAKIMTGILFISGLLLLIFRKRLTRE